jgi:hypothetical protein
MSPELGPPELDEYVYPHEDVSWTEEWRHFRSAIVGGDAELLGDLASARYALAVIARAYDAETAGETAAPSLAAADR